MTVAQRDLVLLVADKNIDHGVRGLLSRPHALGIRRIDAESLVHPRHDPAFNKLVTTLGRWFPPEGTS